MSSIEVTLQTLKLVSPEASCNTDLTKGPWLLDTGGPDYGPGSSQHDVAPANTPRQGQIPVEYQDASDQELTNRILAAWGYL